MFPQTDPGGKAVIYNQPFASIPELERPNDATISFYQERFFNLIKRRDSQGRLYTIKPKGNAVEYVAALFVTTMRELSMSIIMFCPL